MITNTVVTNKQAFTNTNINILSVRNRLGLIGADYDVTLSNYFLQAINIVEQYTDLALSPRHHTIFVRKGSGIVYLSGGLITSTPILSSNVTDSSVFNNVCQVSSESDFSIDYDCGYLPNTIPEDIEATIFQLIEMLFSANIMDMSKAKMDILFQIRHHRPPYLKYG